MLSKRPNNEYYNQKIPSLPDRVKTANIAQAVNVLQAVVLTDEEKMILTPTYQVMKMYAAHQDALLLPTFVENVDFKHNNEPLPAINVSASRDKSGTTNISLVNIDLKKPISATVQLHGRDFDQAFAKLLKADKINDHNSFTQPEKITPSNFKDFKIETQQIELTIPPFSVLMLELK